MDGNELNRELRLIRQGLWKIRSSRGLMKIKAPSDFIKPLGAFAEDDPEVHASFCTNDSSITEEFGKLDETDQEQLSETN